MVERYKRPSETPPPPEGVFPAIAEKLDELLAARRELLRSLEINTGLIRDAMGAAHLFGGELEFPEDIDDGLLMLTKKQHDSLSSEPVQRSLFEPIGDQTIREAVLAYLQAASPNGMKAREIRDLIESKIGRELHFKTIGMTLYRLSERGLAHREGYTWYITPLGAERETPAS